MHSDLKGAKAPWHDAERLQRALDDAHLGLWDGDIASGAQDWNEQSYRHFGLPVGEDMTNARFLSLLAPEDRQRVGQAWRQAAEGREDYRVDYPITWPDGSRHWILTVGRVQCGPDGQPIRMSGIHLDITAQKAAEREIQARTAELEAEIAAHQLVEAELRLFKAVVEVSEEAIAISRPDGQLHYINPAHEKLFGYALAEARERNYRDYYPPASVVILEEEVVPRLARGESWKGELEVQDRGGRRFPLWERAGALRQIDGTLDYAFGFMHEISKRRATEMALVRKEEEQRKLIDGLPIGVVIAGFPDYQNIHYINEQFTRVYGYTLEDIPTAEDWFVKAYPDPRYRSQVRELWDQALRGSGERQGSVESHEYRIRCKDGQTRPTLISAVMLEGRLVGTLVDLSTYHQLEERARRSEERFRLIAEHSRDLIWTMNLAGEFTYLSPSLEPFLGYTPEEYRSLPPGSIFSPESYARVQEILAAARARIAAGLPCAFEAELENRAKDGSCPWSQVVAVAMYDRDGQFTEFMGISRDITLRKRQEEALRQARDVAEAANAAKSRFLATITHELRTPLHAILGFTQVLAGLEEAATRPVASPPAAGVQEREARQAAAHAGAMASATAGANARPAKRPRDKEGQRRQELLAGIDRNGRHLLTLVNDLLDLSRLEGGHLALRPYPTALRPLLDDCLADFAALAAERGLGLYLKVPPGLPAHVLIDRQRLRQILANLLGNAVKFTARGEVTLMAEAHPGATRPGTVALGFCVTDTGPGIGAAAHELIFSPFGREDDGLTGGKPKGNGLGLAICRQLAALMGGEIRLDSVPGEGSRFTLWLPAVPLTMAAEDLTGAAAGAVPLPAAPAGSGDERSAPLTPGLTAFRPPSPPPTTFVSPGPSPARERGPAQGAATLLVIDDEPDNRRLAAEILRDQGLDLVSAPDGATGLRLAAALRPDLILLDVRMPGLNGFEVCARLKSLPATRDIPVIFLSALDHYEDKARGFAVGGVDYVTKPCDARELLLRITNHLRLARPAASPGGEPEAPEVELATDRSLLILLQARDTLLMDLANPPDLNTLARACGTNRTTLQQLFHAKLGMSVFGYVREQRLQRARALLTEGVQGIDAVALRVGYCHGSNLSRAFKQRFGLAPSQLPPVGKKLPSG